MWKLKNLKKLKPYALSLKAASMPVCQVAQR